MGPNPTWLVFFWEQEMKKPRDLRTHSLRGTASEKAARGWPSADQAERPQEKPTLSAPSPGVSSSQSCEGDTFLSFKPPGLWASAMTARGSLHTPVSQFWLQSAALWLAAGVMVRTLLSASGWHGLSLQSIIYTNRLHPTGHTKSSPSLQQRLTSQVTWLLS